PADVGPALHQLLQLGIAPDERRICVAFDEELAPPLALDPPCRLRLRKALQPKRAMEAALEALLDDLVGALRDEHAPWRRLRLQPLREDRCPPAEGLVT